MGWELGRGSGRGLSARTWRARCGRCSAGIEDAIIVESRDAMAYRSGLMRRGASRRRCGPVRSGASPAPAPWSWASTFPTCRWASTWGCRTRWDTSGSGPVGWDATARDGSSSWRRAAPSSSTRTAWRPTGDSRWSRRGSIHPIPTSGTPTGAAWPGRRT